MENWASAVGVASASLAGSVFLLHKYRYADKTVNCWFCNKTTVVPYGNVNCWDCPNCEQYNGFDKDGGYNKSIPAQFSEDLNHGINCQSKDYLGPTSTICSTCQQNQQMKIRQLSIFEPLIEENYDLEVEAYKQQLERNYRLCSDCQARVDMELRKQNKMLQMKLIGTKFDQSATLDETVCSTSGIETKEENSWKLFNLFSCMAVVVATILLFNASLHISAVSRSIPSAIVDVTYHHVQPYSSSLVILATISSLLSKLLVGKNRLYMIDNIDCVSWLLLLLINFHFLPCWMFPVLPVFFIHCVSVIAAICCLIRSRPLSNATTATFKRLSLDKSNTSDASTVISSVSTSKKAAEVVKVLEAPVPMSNPSQDLDGLDFGVCSLGSKPIASKDSGMFSWTGSACSMDTVSSLPYIPSPVRQRRPLISPAKLQFNASKPTSLFGQTKTTSSKSLFCNGADEKLSLFGNMSVASKLPEPAQTLNGIKAPSLFKNMPSCKREVKSYTKHEQLQQANMQMSTHIEEDTTLTTEKLSMFNMQQSTIRPKMFQNHRYLCNDSLENVSSSNLIRRRQDGSYSTTEPSTVNCAVDSTTNPEIQLQSQSSDQSLNSSSSQIKDKTSWKFYLIFGVVGITVSVAVNIAVHMAWNNYLL